MTLIPKVSFRCVKCWKYSPKIKCRDCFPSPCFPLYCEKYPPKDYEGYKKWDHWYVWRYLLEQDEDPEAIYEIGSTEIIEKIQRSSMIEKMASKDRFKYSARIYLGMSSECKAFKYRFAKRRKNY